MENKKFEGFNSIYVFAILEKVKSTHTRLRDDRIDGITPCVPRVGEVFYMGQSPKDPDADMRIVRTSPVKSVTSRNKGAGKVYDFETENSTYRLTTWEFFG
jgi:hypothetical protein